MEIAIIGTGYVGLVSGACFAEMGAKVTCVDINEQKIEKLKNGIIPIYEPGLDELVLKNTKSARLSFTTDIKECIDSVDIVFIAVGTPQDEDGSADLQYVLETARTIGKYMNNYLLVATKSTVPVGTAQKIRETIQAELTKRNLKLQFDVASNPEFLKEGNAIEDFMKPDRVIIGVDTEKAKEMMSRLYKPVMLNNFRVIFMDIPSAEMTKYASNAMLATRISFMNDIANLCELVGADVSMVRKGIGSDARIGSKFLYPGCGYGGSCFPKDVKALIKTAEDNNYELKVLKSVDKVNNIQKEILFKKFTAYFNGDIKGRKAAIWGLSFKPETDDMREAPSVVLINSLLDNGCTVNVFDPVAMEEAKRIVGDKVNYSKDIYDAAIDADAVFLVTEWKEFRMVNWNVIRKVLKTPLVIDGRNIYDAEELKAANIHYLSIGNK
ncbi:MAG: UDP-glucose dehydrogenase family protein [Paludibacteraceae bacterium]